MGTIILHSGRPKAGSSSIQKWLANRSDWLRDEHGVHVIVARDRQEEGGKRWHLVPFDNDGVNSGLVVRRYLVLGEAVELAERFCHELDQHAERSETVVVTSEAFARIFDEVSVPFLHQLDSLAREHVLRVAHYVRPQHTSFEASWRQWGFRSGLEPSDYLAELAPRHQYWSTSEAVADVAPSIRLEMRPFRDDALNGGDVVVDFAQHFLGLPIPANPRRERSNTGLPLAFVNLLRDLPPGELWDDEHDNRRLDRLKPLVQSLSLSDPPEIARSRDVLMQWCHERFESGNQELIRSGGWPLDWFVPPVPHVEGATLDQLDVLWSAETAARDEATRAALHTARRMLADGPGDPRGDTGKR